MNPLACTWALGAVALCGGVATGQIRKGDTPSEFAFIQTWNGAPQAFGDLRGKVVILDFTQSW
ncbi:MAG: hypothetical protein WAT39_22620 [Planctomycetota bacterium]